MPAYFLFLAFINIIYEYRPTEHVSDGVKNCFGCTILILLHRYNPPTVCRRLEELFSSISWSFFDLDFFSSLVFQDNLSTEFLAAIVRTIIDYPSRYCTRGYALEWPRVLPTRAPKMMRLRGPLGWLFAGARVVPVRVPARSVFRSVFWSPQGGVPADPFSHKISTNKLVGTL